LSNLTREEALEFSETLKNINWKDPKEREAFAKVVVDDIRTEVESYDFIDLIADVRDYGLTDVVEFEAHKGAKAYIIAPGAYAPRSTIIRRTLHLDTDEVVVSLGMNMDKLKTGRYGTVADLKANCSRELVGMRYGLLWDALKYSVGSTDEGALDGSTNYYGALTTASGAAAWMFVVNKMINVVDDLPHGGIVGIIGRRKLFDAFTQFDGYSQEYLQRRDSKMLIESYRGIPLIPIKQYTDGYDIARISATELFMITKGCVKMGYRKRVEMDEDKDIHINEWQLVMRENYGIGVLDPDYCFRLHIAS
jgi:hypothetical protein